MHSLNVSVAVDGCTVCLLRDFVRWCYQEKCMFFSVLINENTFVFGVICNTSSGSGEGILSKYWLVHLSLSGTGNNIRDSNSGTVQCETVGMRLKHRDKSW